MRFIWLPFCCILVGVTHAQADSYRDKDEGFNPMNVMQGMPNPMNMFDSENRDDRLRHRPPPPPPRMAPGYPYPAPPGYAPPPRAPYYAAPNIQPPVQTPLQRPPQAPEQADVGPSPAPAAAAPYGAVPPPAGISQGPSPVMPESAQPAYSFRPMTAPEPDSVNDPVAAEQSVTANPPPPTTWQFPKVPESGQTVITEPYPEQETPMVNGQPAIFRPMNQGVDNPPSE